MFFRGHNKIVNGFVLWGVGLHGVRGLRLRSFLWLAYVSSVVSSALRLFILNFIAWSLIGCGLKIGESAPQDKPVAIGGAGSSCLSQISENVEAYVEDRLPVPKIRKFGSCIRYALESFSKHARGQNRNSYTPIEIRDFLQEYFLKENHISDQLLRDLMEIKQTLVGGSVDLVTKSDLSEALAWIQFLEDQAVRLAPYVRIYNFNLGKNWVIQNVSSASETEDGIRAFHEVAYLLGQRLSRANRAYNVAHLESFMREFRVFSGWEQVFTNSRTPESWSQFVRAYKSITLGQDTDLIRPQDWPVLVHSAASLFTISLRLKYAGQAPSFFYGEGLLKLDKAFEEFDALMKQSIQFQLNRVVTYDQVDAMIDAMVPLGLLPRVPVAIDGVDRTVRPQSLKDASRALFNRIFADITIPWRTRKNLGLTSFVLGEMTKEYGRWSSIQHLLGETFRDREVKWSEGVQLETLTDRTGPMGSSMDLARLFASKDRRTSDLAMIQMMAQSLRPLFRPGEKSLFLTEQNQLSRHGVVHGFHGLSMLNFSRAVVGLVGRGYSTLRGPVGLFDGGITGEEMQALYIDFKGLGVDMQFFDPRSENSGFRVYQEANLFTYSGNGLRKPSPKVLPRDSMMSFPEGLEYFLFVFSGGVMGRKVYSGMMGHDGFCTEASKGSPISIHGYPMIERQCFKTNLLKVLLPHMDNMPKMKAEFEKLSEDQRVGIADNLMTTIYSPTNNNPDFIEWHEVSTLTVIMHYIESVMTRYNRDDDNVLKTEEVWDAYKTFGGYIQQMAEEQCRNGFRDGEQDDRTQNEDYRFWELKRKLKKWIRKKGCSEMPEFVAEAVFAHLIKHGEIPNSFWDINLLPRDQFFKMEFIVDRQGLLRVFAALVKSTAEPPKKTE